jgi:hypothetical protein
MGTELDTLAVENCLLRKEEQDPSLRLRHGPVFDPD